MQLKRARNSKIFSRSFFVIILVLSLLLGYFVNLLNISQANLKQEIQSAILLTKQLNKYKQDYRFPIPTPSQLDYESESSLPIFLSKIYPKSLEIQKLVKKQSIKRAFNVPIPYLERGKDTNSAWIVEEEKINNPSDELGNTSYAYYYVNSQTQKLLLEPMSSSADINGKGCRLEDYTVTNTSDGKNGYLIFSSGCWYGDSSISIYNAYSGEKIIIKSNIQENNTNHQITSLTGNIFRKIIGLYGINNPTLFVESKYEATALSEIHIFDLKNRKLIQNYQFK